MVLTYASLRRCTISGDVLYKYKQTCVLNYVIFFNFLHCKLQPNGDISDERTVFNFILAPAAVDFSILVSLQDANLLRNYISFDYNLFSNMDSSVIQAHISRNSRVVSN